MYELFIIYLVPLCYAFLRSALLIRFACRFGEARIRCKGISFWLPAICWTIVQELINFLLPYPVSHAIWEELAELLLTVGFLALFFRLRNDLLWFVGMTFCGLIDAIQSFLSDVFELIDYQRAIDFLSEHGMITPRQYFLLLNSASLLMVIFTCGAQLLLLWGSFAFISRTFRGVPRKFTKQEAAFLLLPPFVACVTATPLILFIILIDVRIFQDLTVSTEERAMRAALEREVDSMKTYLEETRLLNENIRGIKHDMKNHVAVLSELAAERKYERLTEYLGQMRSSLEKTERHFSTGSPAVDTLLSMKEREMKEAFDEIEFSTERLLFPKEFSLNEYDVVVLLGNLLDNAIESCKKVHAAANDTRLLITLSSIVRGRMVLLEVENPMIGTVMRNPRTGFPLTDKDDRLLHGIGFSNMKRIAEKYYGTISWEAKDGCFRVTVMVQMG